MSNVIKRRFVIDKHYSYKLIDGSYLVTININVTRRNIVTNRVKKYNCTTFLQVTKQLRITRAMAPKGALFEGWIENTMGDELKNDIEEFLKKKRLDLLFM